LAGWSIADLLPYPKYLERVMLKNWEKSFSRSLHAPISDIWRKQLRPQSNPTGSDRHRVYIAIASSDIDRSDLFKPAPYLLADTQISPSLFSESVPSTPKKYQLIITCGRSMANLSIPATMIVHVPFATQRLSDPVIQSARSRCIYSTMVETALSQK
jgi:hypothetical protein